MSRLPLTLMFPSVNLDRLFREGRLNLKDHGTVIRARLAAMEIEDPTEFTKMNDLYFGHSGRRDESPVEVVERSPDAPKRKGRPKKITPTI